MVQAVYTNYECVRVTSYQGHTTTVSLPKELFNAAKHSIGDAKVIRSKVRQWAKEFNEDIMNGKRSWYVQQKLSELLQSKQASETVAVSPSEAPLDLNSASFMMGRKPVELAKMTYLGHRMSIQAMPTDVFHSLPECPVQRDTLTRSKSATHLKTASPLHASVIATSVNGEIRKLDGHTRDNCWNVRGSLEAPPAVICLVVECDNYEQVEKLYDKADSRAAAERAKEKVWGSWKSLGYVTSTPFFASNGPFLSAVSNAFSDHAKATAPRELAQASAACVKLLESHAKALSAKTRPMLVAAALIVVRKLMALGKRPRVAEVAEFLKIVSQAQGREIDGKCDAVKLLLDTFTGEKRRGGAGAHNEELGFALAALSRWMESSEVSFKAGSLQPLTRADYLGELEVKRKCGRQPKDVHAVANTKQVPELGKSASRARKVEVPPLTAYVQMPMQQVEKVAPRQLPSLSLKRPRPLANYNN